MVMINELRIERPRPGSRQRTQTTRVLSVQAVTGTDRPRDSDDTLAAQLQTRHIEEVGLARATSPLEIRSGEVTGSLFVAAFDPHCAGELPCPDRGRGTDSASLLRSPATLSFDVPRGRVFDYAFVVYRHPQHGSPVFPDAAYTTSAYDARPLVQAIRGLHAESASKASSASLHHWVELIHGYVLSFTQPLAHDPRIGLAWRKIEARLSHPWTVEDMAAAAMMSSEHFRRLCLKHLGCSPMKHLSTLRIQRAADMLVATDLKIEAICDEVGYEHRSTFSNLFKRMTGVRPSDYRESVVASRHGR